MAKNKVGSVQSTTGTTTVWVALNHPWGLVFDVGGKSVTLEGAPVSKLRNGEGQHLFGGLFGFTEVNTNVWEAIHSLYGQMSLFQSGRLFAAPTRESVEAMARERSELRHGFEPVDPEKTASVKHREEV